MVHGVCVYDCVHVHMRSKQEIIKASQVMSLGLILHFMEIKRCKADHKQVWIINFLKTFWHNKTCRDGNITCNVTLCTFYIRLKFMSKKRNQFKLGHRNKLNRHHFIKSISPPTWTLCPSGKILTICPAGGSPLGHTDADLHPLAPS